MQQGSVGDGESVSKNSTRNSNEADGRVRVKLEALESADAFDVKYEPQEEYQSTHQEYHYERKPPIVSPIKREGSNTEIVNHCQSQGYPRPVTSVPNSYGFSHFYGPISTATMLPPSFPTARPGSDRTIDRKTIDDHEQERYRVTGVNSDSVFSHRDHGMNYAAFRASMQQIRGAYAEHQNNSGYRSAQYQNRKRKWSGAALRGMAPPSMPVP
ncbi:uncharacterized protein LOC108627305, partial [Ceratina calcarata]|uniref:Uncharacterized protein LOC108627305 n=1 Tax=Ceratina calcarata TaxID=156304 RepID=A0AAJ7J3S2_9HYME